MRRSAGRLLALLLAAGAGLTACHSRAERAKTEGAAVDTSAVRAAIDSVRRAFERDVADGSLDRGAEIYHAEAIKSDPGRPPIRGRDSIVALQNRQLESGNSDVRLEPIETRVMGERWAYEFGTATVTGTAEASNREFSMTETYLAVYRRGPNGWKLYREAYSLDRAPGGGE